MRSRCPESLSHETFSHEALSHETPSREAFSHEVPSHEAQQHLQAERHHHHSHAEASQHAGGHHLLQVEDLSISFEMYETDAPFFRAKKRRVRTIDSLSVSVHVGEIVAVVGASGSGKTLLADSIMGIFEPNATVEGRVWFDGQRQDASSLAQLRGNGISLVPQSVAYLDPLMTVGRQVRGTAANRADRQRRIDRQRALFARYGLAPDVEQLYPHELSGGMARRVLLCCALMEQPKLIVADEPTPGLDLDLARRALDDLRSFADEGGGVLLITHDIELALLVADRVAVFKDGTVVEETAVASFASPERLEHPFSRALWHALPEHDFCACTPTETAASEDSDGELPEPVGERPIKTQNTGGASRELSASSALRSAQTIKRHTQDEATTATEDTPHELSVQNISFGFDAQHLLFEDFSISVQPGERVALEAPSGRGKTTLCRILAGYEQPQQGSVLVDGRPLPWRGSSPVQLIGQHPEHMLDPRIRMQTTLEEAGSIDECLCEALGIEADWMRRFPHELSGGQLQRFCIARALRANPRYLIADEISTMLDALTQARLWSFLLEEVDRRGMGLLFVSHVPALTRRTATRTVSLEP